MIANVPFAVLPSLVAACGFLPVVPRTLDRVDTQPDAVVYRGCQGSYVDTAVNRFGAVVMMPAAQYMVSSVICT